MKQDSLQIIKTHNGRYGYVYMSKSDKFYSVQVVLYSAKLPADEQHRSRGRMDLQTAIDFYNNAVRFIQRKQPWTEPRNKCAYKPDKIKTCCASNCPRKLGGSVFHEIFGLDCHYRTR